MTERTCFHISQLIRQSTECLGTFQGLKRISNCETVEAISGPVGRGHARKDAKTLLRFSLSTLLGIPVVLMMVSILALTPKQATASGQLAAIGTAVSITEKIISFSNTDDDEISEVVLENKELLLEIHQRLDAYDATFGKILEKLDELPDEFQRQFDQAFDIDQMREVRGAIQLILSDMRVDEKSVVGATSRLGDLQREAQTLLNHNSDFIFFDALAAMYVEQAIIALQPGYTKDELRRIIENRRRDYHSRFKDMLLPWEDTRRINAKKFYESLPEVRTRAESSLGEYINEVDSIISSDVAYRQAYYSHNSTCGAFQCYGNCYEAYTLLDSKVKDVQKQFRKTVAAIGHVERALLLYRNMWNALRIELGGAGDSLEQEDIGNIADSYRDKEQGLRVFGKLKKYIREAGYCPHG